MHRINLYFHNVSASSAFGLLGAASFAALGVLSGRRFPHKRRFEHDTQDCVGIAHAIAVAANRSGLYALLTALNVGDGDEVIVTGFTCSAVAEPILQRGAKPVYVDIAPATFCINPALLESVLTSRSRVIILQHTYGFPGPVEAVMEIARRHGLLVIEDCALALGSKKDGRWLGTFGDAAVWSFELSKTISVGWGGLIGINRDQALAKRVGEIVEGAGVQNRLLAAQRLLQGGVSGILYHHRTPHFLRSYGLAALFKFRIFRSSADTPASDMRLPSDRQWKYLLWQWQRLDTTLSSSKAAQRAYEKVLSFHGCDSRSSRHAGVDTYLIRFPLLVKDPGRFVAFFAVRDIEAGRWFSSPVSSGGKSPTLYGYAWGSCPVAEKVCNHVVNLPLHGRLTAAHVAWIAETLNQYLSNHPVEVAFIRHSLTPEFFKKIDETSPD
jgi:perosamine synthetase